MSERLVSFDFENFLELCWGIAVVLKDVSRFWVCDTEVHPMDFICSDRNSSLLHRFSSLV